MTEHAALAAMVRADATLMDLLALCRDALPVPAWIGAGAVRNAVWDHLHGRPPQAAGDVDVVFFDADLAPSADAKFARRLATARPDVRWDVVNQAHVHRWYRDCFGRDAAPLASLEQGIATWPETATALAVRLDVADDLHVIAPFGLVDLFGPTLRWNPARASHADFLARVHGKGWLRRWPRLRLADAAAVTQIDGASNGPR